jgi:PHP family Zn ribbon phosphoesterase
MNLKLFTADLHVHSLLSPCAELEMTPHNIVNCAELAGVDILAITDHNACDNVAAAMMAAEGRNVIVLPGMEVETLEEVHLVVLFDSLQQIKQWEVIVDQNRRQFKNNSHKFGEQFIVDSNDELLGIKAELLLTSLTLDIAAVTAMVQSLGGISIAAHVDRPTYSIFAQLGFIPDNVMFQAVEVSRRTSVTEARCKFPAIGDMPVITSSDAHTLQDFISGPKTFFYMERPCLSEIILALAGKQQRKVMC